MTQSQSFRAHLRSLPSLVGEPRPFDPAARPPTPQELFLQWFQQAQEAGVPEPHAMTLSTIGSDGIPDSRMLVLKDLSPDGAWCFAGGRDSAKGRELAQHPVAAVLFYWREQVRSVRIRGRIREASPDEARSDFLARHAGARAVTVAGRQSAPVDDGVDLAADVEAATRRISAEPDLTPSSWALWMLDPTEVEFWQGSRTRIHERLLYRRVSSGWETSRLRP
ncbi:MAG TPA: pyridoxal 5'-phosphate synthase [Pseudolysinimonas sp.]|nr:pyridoxal 5'-phosphate synthase [Pseudolysinimonas sp.]